MVALLTHQFNDVVPESFLGHMPPLPNQFLITLAQKFDVMRTAHATVPSSIISDEVLRLSLPMSGKIPFTSFLQEN